MTAPICPHCNQPAKLVTGSDIYRNRPDLDRLQFWKCATCADIYCGCHETGDGTTPKGTLAGRSLREARMRAHRAFDPIWRDGSMKRSVAYAALAKHMGIEKQDCHIGMFTEVQCFEVVKIVFEMSGKPTRSGPNVQTGSRFKIDPNCRQCVPPWQHCDGCPAEFTTQGG